MTSRFDEALLISAIFGAWMVAVHLVAIPYLFIVSTFQSNFNIRIRLPSLTIVEVLIIEFCATTICLREIFCGLWLVFPFWGNGCQLCRSHDSIRCLYPLKMLAAHYRVQSLHPQGLSQAFQAIQGSPSLGYCPPFYYFLCNPYKWKDEWLPEKVRRYPLRQGRLLQS